MTDKKLGIGAWFNLTILIAIVCLNFTPLTHAKIVINEVLASNASVHRDAQGEYDDWIELFNTGRSAIDIGGMYLTDNPDNPLLWQIPPDNPAATTLAPGGFLLIWADKDVTDSGLHTGFKLNTTGETVSLYAADGVTLIDRVTLGKQDPDIAYGRFPDGNDSWRYLAEPSPGAANEDTYLGFVADTKFGVDRGFYDQPFYLTITTATAEATVYYTLDGSAPEINKTYRAPTVVYTEPILIDKTTCVRALAHKPGWKPTNVDTQTYLFLNEIIDQPRQPEGFPPSWKSHAADYEMDPAITQDRIYQDKIRDALLSLPSMSLVMDREDLFGNQGIYANPQSRGVAWERPGSIEWIEPNRVQGWQINCGIRIQGGYFRRMTAGRKKSFRLLFKGIYGDTKLRIPLFGPEAADSFDTITLRAGANDGYTWNTARGTEQYLRDEFARRLQLATGQAAARGTFVHLYVNGLYWGLYNPVERPDASFSANYYGGDKEDWDVFSHKRFALNQGDHIALNQMLDECRSAANSFESYQRLQGMNVDGSLNPDTPHLLDVPNFIDYMIVNYWGGNWDWPWNNYWLARKRTVDSTGFKFYCWDAEDIMLSPRSPLTINKVTNPDTRDVGEAHGWLRQNSEYRLQFADRIHRLFWNEGPFTPSRLVKRYTDLANQIELAMIAESARWGDQQSHPPLTQNDWFAMRDRILEDYLPRRSDIVMQQFRQADLYPNLTPPTFEIDGLPQHKGQVATGSHLAMIAPQGDIWYTLDGSDPRTPGSSAGSEASVHTIVAEGASKRVLVPSSSVNEDWLVLNYDDSNWISGTGGVGYEAGNGYQNYFAIDVRALMHQRQTSCLIRIPFSLNMDPQIIDRLDLRMRYDDGFVAYLNGFEVARANAPQTLAWNAQATAQNSDGAAVSWEAFTINNHLAHLRPGDNLLAIHGLNIGTNSSDFLVSVELSAREVNMDTPSDSGISPTATLYTSPQVMTETALVKARAVNNGIWSALNETTYSVGPILESLRVTEIMYHPQDQGHANDADTEYLELGNIGSEPLNLKDIRFTEGITFEFPAMVFDPGGYLVLVRDRTAFTGRHGTDLLIAGEYNGRLDNGGESLRLEDACGTVIQEFSYRDDWYPTTDGEGHSLTVVDTSLDPNAWNNANAWQASVQPNGTPGTD